MNFSAMVETRTEASTRGRPRAPKAVSLGPAGHVSIIVSSFTLVLLNRHVADHFELDGGPPAGRRMPPCANRRRSAVRPLL